MSAFTAHIRLNVNGLQYVVFHPSRVSPCLGAWAFHQQMVYAVARKTIEHFEQALGRRALWSSRRTLINGRYEEEYVERLRIYPHALREANAYYSSAKKALLFGYFPAMSTK